MITRVFFTSFILLVAGERLVELALAKRHAKWSFQQGGFEVGRAHYPWMVLLHCFLLVSAVLEVWFLQRPWDLNLALCMLALVVGAQALRWWVIVTLGKQWNTRIIVVPGATRIARGPFSFCNHPNYVAVAVEGLALPLVHGAWLTGLVFTVLNAWLMVVRIRCENIALGQLHSVG